MKFRLMRMQVSGIKNIQTPVVVDFLDSTIGKSVDTAKSNVKAIYGPNGSGKSALITAVKVYKELTENYGFLVNENNQIVIRNLINKITKDFDITMTVAVTNPSGKVVKVISHRVVVDLKKNIPYVKQETIKEYVGQTINGECTTIIDVINGSIQSGETIEDENLKNSINAISGFSSIVSLIMNPAFSEKSSNTKIEEKKPSSLLKDMLMLALFERKLEVYFDESDHHVAYSKNNLEKTIEKLKLKIESEELDISINEDVILKKDFQEYEKQVNKLKQFVQLFKSDLRDIKIVKKAEGNKYHVRKEFVYDGYSIDEEYESAGIKRLVKMFSALVIAAHGGIVFVDELDANINSVNLENLIQYFMSYADGQLIFTTHNTAPMTLLKTAKHSIDFLNYDNNLISWVRNGHRSPEKQYKEGVIPGIPHNIEDFDFLPCFYREAR